MQKLIATVAVLACLVGACTGGAGGGDGTGDGTGAPAGDPPGGGTEPGDGTGTEKAGDNGGGATNTTNVAIPEIFYGGWDYHTATLYQPGEEPIVTSVSGSADFRKDLTYEQSYSIGGIGNFYAGRYTVDGPDPKMAGAFLITTYDEDDNEAFKFSVACGDTKGMALTIYDDAGEPSIVYGLEARE